MSHIIKLTASNVKRLKAVTITPDGKLVVIGGRNGAGKSSVLDSIAMALGGKGEVPQMPVRSGEESAEIVAELDDLVVRRTIAKDGSSSLEIRTRDELGKLGPKMPSPQSILDKLTGKLTFDPLAFLRLDPKQQGESLRKLVGIDLAEHDAKRKRIYDERTVVNAEVTRLRSTVGTMPHHKDAPEEEVSVDSIMVEMQKAQEVNSVADSLKMEATSAKSDFDAANRSVAAAEADIAIISAEIERLQRRLSSAAQNLEALSNTANDLKRKAENAEQAAASAPRIDLSIFQQKLKDSQSENQKVRENRARDKVITEGRAAVEKSEEMTRRLAIFDAERVRLIQSAKYPVEGLEFSDSGVVFNGVPLNQASAAEQLRVSVAIAAAANPTLKVMLVRDGSLLDDNGLKLLGELAEKHDLQVWIERVGDGAECSVVIEDGEVRP